MNWTYAVELADLKKNNRITTTIDGNKILFIWHENKVHAVESQCPHFKLPLNKATITAENEIVCPFHRSAFDLCTGKVKCWAPWPAVVSGLLGKISKPKTLKIYPTLIDNERVMVDVQS
ncbi:MAG: Rieske (2Fe-2S) protein [Legionellaceae bacterium]|nr:Rieske (2Fe-2S) protein [Legionellaceae bacterium]